MHVVYFIDNLSSGGAQRQVVALAGRIHGGLDAKATIVTYRPGNFYRDETEESRVPVVCIDRGASSPAGFALRLRRWILDNAPDVLHSFLLRPGFWAFLALRTTPGSRRPIFVAAERCELEGRSRTESMLQRIVYPAADMVTANSLAALEQIHVRLGLRRERLRYLPNGIDLPAWDSRRLEPLSMPSRRRRFRIALVGGFRPQKNHGMMLEALMALPKERLAAWEVLFVGDRNDGDAYPSALEAQIERMALGEVVTLLPATRAIASFMRNIDALVLPSRYEGFPNVVLEAMASGLPVVATPAGDVPALVRSGETGFVVPLGDPSALARALMALDDAGPEERARMGAAARRAVEENFELGVVAHRHADLYRELMSRRGARPG